MSARNTPPEYPKPWYGHASEGATRTGLTGRGHYSPYCRGGRLVSAVLIHLAAEPYADAGIQDPFFDSGDYELAREVQAMERLLRGRLASRIGA